MSALPVPVTRTQELSDALAPFHMCPVITVDTEFMRESTFWPSLCLIQLACQGHNVLIDTLAPGLNLSPFFNLMADRNVLKVFHAARQDIEIIYHLSGLIPYPVFDTQIASMVCGYGDSISYSALVCQTTGREIDKGQRDTDWTCRPLSKEQLVYALADVTHLLDVYHILDKALCVNGRLFWVQEEVDILLSPSTYNTCPEEAWRRLKMKVRKPCQISVFKALAAWREREARRRNLPRLWVMKDNAIHEIALQMPRTMEALFCLRSLGPAFRRSGQSESILLVVSEALSSDFSHLSCVDKPYSLPGGAKPVVEFLKVLLKKVCEEEGVADRLLATVSDLEKLSVDDCAAIPALQGWRRELFGETALRLKRGEIALTVEKGRVVIFPLEG